MNCWGCGRSIRDNDLGLCDECLIDETNEETIADVFDEVYE